MPSPKLFRFYPKMRTTIKFKTDPKFTVENKLVLSKAKLTFKGKSFRNF